MARQKKDNTPMSIRIDTQLFNRLNDYCARSGQTKTTAVERALEMFIDDYDNKMKKLKEQ